MVPNEVAPYCLQAQGKSQDQCIRLPTADAACASGNSHNASFQYDVPQPDWQILLCIISSPNHYTPPVFVSPFLASNRFNQLGRACSHSSVAFRTSSLAWAIASPILTFSILGNTLRRLGLLFSLRVVIWDPDCASRDFIVFHRGVSV